MTGLAVPAAVLASLGWHVLAESQYRVERGRIGSDIYSALLAFDLEKSALRNWSYRRALDQAAEASERAALLEAMQEQVERITTKAELAAMLDRQRGKILQEHDDRSSLLIFLQDVVDQLDLETDLLLNDGVLEPTQLSDIDLGFDQLRGVSFADAIRVAFSAEAEALTRERDRANESLTAARRLFLSAGGFGLLATFVLALLLAKRFRQPFRELEAGLQAYAQGHFSHRFTRFRDKEFEELGQQLNAMAREVELARIKSEQSQAELERRVEARTAELQCTLDELSASEGARQKLLADVGHELRTPVTVIRGEAQVALRSNTQRSQFFRDALDRIVQVSRQMEHLIEDLLVLVRDPKGQPVVNIRPTPMADVVCRALDTARSIAALREVTLHSPTPLPRRDVLADPDRLHQVVTSLLDNAIRYSHPGGEIWLTMYADNAETVLLEVRDQGIGLDTGEVEKVFDRGWRSKAARTHRPDGLGLGLSIARYLTDAQGGHLKITPGQQGHGVVATLELRADPIAEKAFH